VSGSSIVTNAIVSPDGTSNGNKLTYNGGSYAFGRSSYTSGAGTFSIFVKKGNWTYVGIRNSHLSGDHSVFDFDKEQFILVQSGHTCTFEKYPNGWYRLIDYQSVSVSPVSGYRGIALCGSDGNENGTGVLSGANVFFWGAQGELSVSYPSSYIRTSGSAVTRSAEAASNSSASSVIGQSQGTIFIDFVFNGKSDSLADNFNLALGTWASNIIVIGNYNSALYARIYESTVLYFNQDFGTMTAGGRYKCAIAYASNDAVFYVNGKLIAADSSVNVPATSTISLNRSSFESSKDVNEVLLFKSRLSNDELASLTSFDDYEELVDAKGLTWESPTITNNRLTALAEL
jgi:hypothetical protein